MRLDALPDLIILALATYRLSIMLANEWEAGPAGLLTKLRERAGLVYTESGTAVAPAGSLADGLTCVYCNSPWIGAVFVLVYWLASSAGWQAGLLFLPLALSAVVTLFDQVLNPS